MVAVGAETSPAVPHPRRRSATTSRKGKALWFRAGRSGCLGGLAPFRLPESSAPNPPEPRILGSQAGPDGALPAELARASAEVRLEARLPALSHPLVPGSRSLQIVEALCEEAGLSWRGSVASRTLEARVSLEGVFPASASD